MLFLTAKVLLTIVFSLFFFILIRLTVIGMDFNKPVTGCRKGIIRCLYWCLAHTMLIIGFYCKTTEHVDVDYSEYLGPDYKETMKPVKKVSTIICNHMSFMDIVILCGSYLQPAFTPSIKFSEVPLLAGACNAL